MKNALAVYTPKSCVKGSQLVDLALGDGIQIRFMAMGGYILGDPVEVQKKSLTAVYGGAILIVGDIDGATESIAEFDKLVEFGARIPIAEILSGGKLPWCELYSSRFDYEKAVKAKPKDKPRIDGSVPAAQLSIVKSAKTRYIFYNQTRKKNSQQFMITLVDCLARRADGVIADYQRPTR